MKVFIIYVCIDLLALTGLFSPSVGHKWCVQTELQALSQLQTGNTDNELIFHLKVKIYIYYFYFFPPNWHLKCLISSLSDSTWSSMVISVVSVLLVFHFWLKLRPNSFILYLVSRWPPDFPVSVLLEPEVANSCGSKWVGLMRREVENEAERGAERHVEAWEHG